MHVIYDLIANAEPIFKDLASELKVQTDSLQEVHLGDLAAFNAKAKRVCLQTVTATAC